MRRLRVLVVEDEFIVAYDLGRVLESMGHEVGRVVGSGDQALEALRDDRPDCVLMDVNIRGSIDGTEVATVIQRELGIPVVFLTGLPAREVKARTEALLPAAVLAKPIDHQELRKVLEAVGEAGRPTEQDTEQPVEAATGKVSRDD